MPYNSRAVVVRLLAEQCDTKSNVMCHSHIRICETYIECSYIYRERESIGIPKHEKHVTTSKFMYKTFYYLWVKGFDIRKRDTIFLSWLLHLSQWHAAPVAHKFVWPQRAPKVDPSRSESNSQLTHFSQIPKSSSHAPGAWRHPHSLAPFPIWAIVTYLSDTSAPPVRVNTCVNVAPK